MCSTVRDIWLRPRINQKLLMRYLYNDDHGPGFMCKRSSLDDNIIESKKYFTIYDGCLNNESIFVSRKIILNGLVGMFQNKSSAFTNTTIKQFQSFNRTFHCGAVNYKSKEVKTIFSKIPIFWVLGGPGSGKGTQCARLVRKYGFVHLSSGDLLRAEVTSGSKKGKELSDMMVKGSLVPREIILDLLKQAMLKKIDSAKGYLIDGYPRESEQAEEFEKKINPCNLIIYFKCSDQILKERVMERARASGRDDDNEETIMKRLQTFHLYSRPLKFKYASKIATIPADTTDVDGIFEATCREVDRIIRSLHK